jgi:ABC-2 type transport system permease protein
MIRAPRRFAGPNWLGLWTLYVKEIRRFLKVAMQTIAAPVVTSMLFLAVFALALGGAGREIGGVPFAEFLAPGLVMMTMAQNSFTNTSSSLIISKVQGNIVDVLMPPLGPAELTIAYACSGVTRGIVVGLASGLAMLPFVGLGIAHPGYVLFHGVAASLMLAQLGVIGGMWAEKFDHMAAVTNFIITPLAFLSGTFYSVERLPPFWYAVAHANPFFFMIDGFRYGVTGHADGSLAAGLIVLTAINAILWLVCHRLFKRGYKLKA